MRPFSRWLRDVSIFTCIYLDAFSHCRGGVSDRVTAVTAIPISTVHRINMIFLCTVDKGGAVTAVTIWGLPSTPMANHR